MNKEDLFESFGALDDDLLKRSEHGAEKRRKNFSGSLKYGSIAAGLVVTLGVGILFHVKVNTTDEDLLAQLRAFDTTGKLLEIEYSEHTAVLE